MQALKLRRPHEDTFKLTSLAPKCYTLYSALIIIPYILAMDSYVYG